MQSFAFGGVTRIGCTVCTIATLLCACNTPSKLTLEQLASLGVSEGTIYWDAEQKLAQEGYDCYVSGAKRENFDFTKKTGFFPTCLLRVQFNVNDQNLVSNLHVADPACIGTP